MHARIARITRVGLVGLMLTDYATRGDAGRAVSRHVTDVAANDRALDATLGIGTSHRSQLQQGCARGCKSPLHDVSAIPC
jgi:hypothetical protein